MVSVLNAQELYQFIPSDPPSREALQALYTRWEKRISPDGTELWLNWIARLEQTEIAVGHFQAGLKNSGEAYIAYTVGKDHQRRGYAFEALTEICRLLRDSLGADPIKAWIDSRNTASIELVKKLGMKQVGSIENADHFKGTQSDEVIFQSSRI